MWSPCLTATLPLQILSHLHSLCSAFTLIIRCVSCMLLFLLTNVLDILGYLNCIIISFSKTYILFISKHFLIMVLPVNNGNISLSCTIYSRFSVQHAHRPQALASCIHRYIYTGKLRTLFACFVHLCVLSLLSTKHHKQKYGKKKLDKAKFTLQACFKITCLH